MQFARTEVHGDRSGTDWGYICSSFQGQIADGAVRVCDSFRRGDCLSSFLKVYLVFSALFASLMNYTVVGAESVEVTNDALARKVIYDSSVPSRAQMPRAIRAGHSLSRSSNFPLLLLFRVPL